ncbi:DUF3152 domain-containing protein [Streptomyces chromofuscus]|uniref:DUF3152 domain-containing protein n=1 Tax=Streptomyces chromofuscus TaxID=42881 RepID=A0A7M2T4I3_STRCW|nr:DUF3152 domain-containing protein [Streptomyces chromofuscus]QOV42805.1 DUF3152 domain-containing protein [Streptomyces chromofuscus]GGS91052.1 hypothetical protein GCM10010254_08640 [Streptomyces chromofuscus]
MGRHSRRGPAPKTEITDKGSRRRASGHSGGQRGSAAQGVAEETPPRGVPRLSDGTPARGVPRLPEGPPGPGVPRFADGTPTRGVPRFPEGTPARGVPRLPDGTTAHGFARLTDGTPARGVPRFAEGTPARGVPRLPDGTPAHGVPRLPDGTPARGVPRLPDGTPAHGMPRLPDGTPAHGIPQVRGGHPEQRERGDRWGELRGRTVAGTGAPAFPRQRQAPPGPRQDYVDAFDERDDVFVRRHPAPPGGPSDPYAPATAHPSNPYASVTSWDTETDADHEPPPTGEPAPAKGGRGRAVAGIAAAAVTTVLAVVVAGQVTGQGEEGAVESRSGTDRSRDVRDSASRGDGRPTPSSTPSATPLAYEQKMDRTFPLSAKLDGSGRFDAIPGIDKAPGAGQKYTYRVDVEQGLGLDGELFAQAVHKTLNDDRSWAHNGGRTFERIHSGNPDFVITLASPGTTADWCAKSGLDTTVDNVSCDSASTERVMINAYRWAQGSETYGDEIHAYRQMLINHEIGHRLGYSHVTCDKDGELAPVMQQQTKFLEHDGIRCKANPWAFPKS